MKLLWTDIYKSIVVLLLCFAGQSYSQACCSATGSLRFAKVGHCQWRTLNTRLSYEPRLHSFNNDGDRSSIGNYSGYKATLLTGYGTKLFTDRFQLNAIIPVSISHASLTSLNREDTRLDLGDIQFGGSFLLLKDNSTGITWANPETFIPFLDLSLSAKAPTGTDLNDIDDVLLQDLPTGDGFWAYTAGLSFIKFLTVHHVVSLQFDRTFFQSRSLDAGEQGKEKKDPENKWGFNYLYVQDLVHSYSISLNLSEIDTGESAVWTITYNHALVVPHWELSVGYSFYSPEFLGLKTTNISYAAPSLSIGLRWNLL